MADGTITEDKLAILTGFTVPELRKLAGRGYFPTASRGQYPVTASISGCFKARKEAAEAAGPLPVYDSMQQCAARTGIPIDRIKAAKRLGCEAFKWNRVSLGPLLACLFRQGGESIDINFEKARAARAEAQRLERQEREASGELLNRAVMERLIAQYLTLPVSQALDGLPAALCDQVNPDDPQLAREVLARWTTETKRLIREGLPKQEDTK